MAVGVILIPFCVVYDLDPTCRSTHVRVGWGVGLVGSAKKGSKGGIGRTFRLTFLHVVCWVYADVDSQPTPGIAFSNLWVRQFKGSKLSQYRHAGSEMCQAPALAFRLTLASIQWLLVD
jgi:hypothetical protein